MKTYDQARILIVDDDPNTVKIVTKALEWENHEVTMASSGEEGLEKLKQQDVDLVLLDVNMPGLSGLETIRLVREHLNYVSVIFLSGEKKTEDVIRGLDAGADDYVCKPFDPAELLARVRTQLRIKRLQDELRVANQRLSELVHIDDLTGLFNMRSVYEKIDLELERARRYGRSVAVIMMDMDHFKSVNDENDHLFGSFVLSEVGRIIKKRMRKIDFAARYGGDEFLIVLTEVNLEGAQAFAENLRSAIEGHLFKNETSEKKLTSSLGLALTNPEQNTNARILVRKADNALYKAKEHGRNQVYALTL